MGPIRKAVNLAAALALTAASVGGLLYTIFFAEIWTGWAFMTTGFFAAVGLYWLWTDFINADPRPEN